MNITTKSTLAVAAIAGILAGATATAATNTTPKAGVKVSTFADKTSQSCKGQSGCKAQSSCKGQNACKGQGGCKSGDNGCKGKNSCKGKGGCGGK